MGDWWKVTNQNREEVRNSAELVLRETGKPQTLHWHAWDVECPGLGCTVLVRMRLGPLERLETYERGVARQRFP